MAKILGEAGVAIMPVTDGFRTKLDSQLRAQMAGLKPELNIGANTRLVDQAVAKIMATVKGARPEMRLQFVTTDAVGELARFEAAVKALSKPKIKLEADMSKADRQIALTQGYLDKLKEALLRGAELNIEDAEALKKIGVIGGLVEGIQKKLDNLKADADVAPLMGKLAEARGMFEDLSKDLRAFHLKADATQLQAEIAKSIGEANALRNDLKDMTVGVDDASALRKFSRMVAEIATIKRQLENMKIDGDPLPLILKLQAARKEADTLMDEMTRPRDIKIHPVIDTSAVVASLSREEALIQSLKSKMSMRADLHDANVQAFLVKTLSNTEMLREKLDTMRAHVDDAEAKIAVDDLTARVIALQERFANLSPHASVSNLLTDFATLENVVGKTAEKFGVFKEEQKSAFADMPGLTGMVGRFGDRMIGAGRDTTNSMNLAGAAIGNVLHAMGRVTLFGGMFNKLNSYLLSFVSGWHLLADVIFEVVAVWVPATIAFAAWGAAAAPVVKNVATQFQNMGTAVAATGKDLKNFKGETQLFSDSMQKAVRPAVWNLLGDAIQVVNARGGQFVKFLQMMNPLVERLGARATVALKNGFNQFLTGGAKMFYQLGTAIGNFLGILGNLGKVVPHYASILLGLGSAFLKLVEDITASPLFQSIAAFGLKMHGALVYLGVFVTLLATVGRNLLGGFLQGFAAARSKIQDFTTAEREAAMATGELDAATAAAGGNLRKAESGATGLAGSMGGLGKATKNGETAMKDAGVASEDTRGKFNKLGSGIGSLVGNMGNLGTKGTRAFKALDEGASVTSRMGSLIKKAGAGVLGLATSFTGLGPVGLGIMAGLAVGAGILYLALHKVNNQTQNWVQTQENLAQNAPIGQYMQLAQRGYQQIQIRVSQAQRSIVNYAETQTAAGRAMKGTNLTFEQANQILQGQVRYGRGAGESALLLLQHYNDLAAGLQQMSGQMRAYQAGINAVTKLTGSQTAAVGLLNAAGITTKQLIADQTAALHGNSGAWQQDMVQIQGTLMGFQAMSPAIGGAASAMNALTLSTSATLSEVQKVTQAYQQFIGIVTGGAQAFAQFQQGMGSLAAALAPPGSAAGGGGTNAAGGSSGSGTFTFRNGKVSASAPVTGSGGVIGGTGQAGAAALAAYVQQIQQAEQLLNALMTQAAAAGNTKGANFASGKAAKDIVAMLSNVPGVQGNPMATSMLGALAQTGGYSGATTDFKGITKWAGSASGATADLNKQMSLLTIHSSNLNQDVARLSNTMGNQLLTAESNAIMAAENMGPKLQNLAKATLAWVNAGAHVGGQGWSQMMKAAGPVASAFLAQTHNVNLARQSLEAYLEQMGVSPAVATKMADALIHATSATKAHGSAARSAAEEQRKINQTLASSIRSITSSGSAWMNYATHLGITARVAANLWAKLGQSGLTRLIHEAGGTESSFVRLAHSLGISASAAEKLWSKFHAQDLAALKTKASETYGAFMRLAHEFGVTGEAAAKMWQRAHQQQFDMLSSKARITQGDINRLAREFGLSSNQASTLWKIMHRQYLDALNGKVGVSYSSFHKWAQAAHLSATEASILWTMLKRQYLDVLTGKANTSYSAFIRLARALGVTTNAASTLWSKAHQQQFDMLSSKSHITANQMHVLAREFGINTNQAHGLWTVMRQQYLDALTSKSGVTKKAFDAWAASVHLSTAEANTLWHMLHQQYFDVLTSKAAHNQGAFQALSGAWGVATNKAQHMWNILHQQQLDMITGKAHMSQAAFEKLAEKLGYSSTQADALWHSLKRTSGNYGVNVHAKVGGGGKVGATVTVSSALQKAINAGTAVPGITAGSNSAPGVSLPHHAQGGIATQVPGWGNHDSVHAMLMPGELIIPKNHAAEFAGMAKRKGIPGFASGGVVGSTSTGVMGGGGVATAQFSGNPGEMSQAGSKILQIPADLTSEVSKLQPMVVNELVEAIQAMQQEILGLAGGIPGGVVSGSAMANLMEIAKYLMTQGVSRAAAAGIASVVYGESAANPESVGSGGFGLIGWTGNTSGLPAGYHGPTGNASRDLAIQMAGIIGYGKANGPWSQLIAMKDPVAAGNLWSSAFERPAVHLSDTRPSIAQQIYGALAGYKGGGFTGTTGASGSFGEGARIVSDAERYVGHPYHWGGASNPSTGWDCSSFASWVLGHDMGLPLPGGSWASVTNSGRSHGPTASAFANLPGAHKVGSNPAQIMPGDVLVWPGHVGFGVGPNKMFSAYGTNFGTIFSNAQAAGGLTIMRYGAGVGGFGAAPPPPVSDTSAFTFNFAEGGLVGDVGAGGSRGAKAQLVKQHPHATKPKHRPAPKPKHPTEAQELAAYDAMLKRVVAYYDAAVAAADAASKQANSHAPTAAQKKADLAAAAHFTSEADARTARTPKQKQILAEANSLIARAHEYKVGNAEHSKLLAIAANDRFAANNAKVNPKQKKALLKEAAILTKEANAFKYSATERKLMMGDAAHLRDKLPFADSKSQRHHLLAEAAASKRAANATPGSLRKAQAYLAKAHEEEARMVALEHLMNKKFSKLISSKAMKTLQADAQELADLNIISYDPLLRDLRAGTGVIKNPKLKNALNTASGSINADSRARAAAASAAAGPIHGVNTGLGANVTRWATDVSKVLAMEGLGQNLLNQVLFQISTESSGNPNAINLWDSNARAGHPSQGLLQTIPSTFKSFHWPGTSSNIDDPIANIAAAVNYARHRYGPTLMHNGMGLGSGRGYALGGIIPEPVFGIGASGKRYSFGERGPERILPGTTPNSGGSAPGMSTYQANTVIGLLQQLVTINKQQPQQMGAAMQRGSGHSARAGFTPLGR